MTDAFDADIDYNAAVAQAQQERCPRCGGPALLWDRDATNKAFRYRCDCPTSAPDIRAIVQFHRLLAALEEESWPSLDKARVMRQLRVAFAPVEDAARKYLFRDAVAQMYAAARCGPITGEGAEACGDAATQMSRADGRAEANVPTASATRWEDDESIVLVSDLGPVGATVTDRDAAIIVRWLNNGALAALAAAAPPPERAVPSPQPASRGSGELSLPGGSTPDALDRAAYLLTKERHEGKVVPQSLGWFFECVAETRAELVAAASAPPPERAAPTLGEQFQESTLDMIQAALPGWGAPAAPPRADGRAETDVTQMAEYRRVLWACEFAEARCAPLHLTVDEIQRRAKEQVDALIAAALHVSAATKESDHD